MSKHHPPPDKEETCSLLEKTVALLERDKRSMLEIANQGGLNYYWLKSFKDFPRSGASVSKVQALYEFLSNRSLKV